MSRLIFPKDFSSQIDLLSAKNEINTVHGTGNLLVPNLPQHNTGFVTLTG